MVPVLDFGCESGTTTPTEDTTMYRIIDTQTKQQVGTRKTLSAAHRYADKLDLQYGAIRYRVERV